MSGAGGGEPSNLDLDAVATMEDFAKLLATARVRAGLPSYRELSRLSRGLGPGVLPPSTLSDIFTGKRLPRREQLLALIEVLGIPEAERSAWVRVWAQLLQVRTERTTERPGVVAPPSAAAVSASGTSGHAFRRWRGRRLALLSVLLVLAVVVAGAAWRWRGEPQPRHVIWIVEKTDSAPAGIPDKLRAHLDSLVAKGTVRLTTYAAGETVRKVSELDISITRESGQLEFDSRLRIQELERRLVAVTTSMRDADVGSSGFSLYHAFRAAESEAIGASGGVEVWLSSTILSGSVPPLDISSYTAADPERAVDDLMAGPMGSVEFEGVELHPVLLTPVGDDQDVLTPASEHWRGKFVSALGDRLGATVHPPILDFSRVPPWDGSSRTSPVLALERLEPLAATRPGQDFLINGLAFIPDQAGLVDSDAARVLIASVVKAYVAGQVIEVHGYAARYGSPDAARELSAARATSVKGLLVAAGIPASAITTVGHGFDELADATQPAGSAAQRAVVITLKSTR